MTREELEKVIQHFKSLRIIQRESFMREGFDVAIKALEQEPSYNSVNSLAESKLKNPKAKTFDILRFVADNAGLSIYEAIEKAYNMGVSEQEQILDKIRAEIENHCGLTKENHCRYCSRCFNLMGVREILEIIDKYKGESKPQESGSDT